MTSQRPETTAIAITNREHYKTMHNRKMATAPSDHCHCYDKWRTLQNNTQQENGYSALRQLTLLQKN